MGFIEKDLKFGAEAEKWDSLVTFQDDAQLNLDNNSEEEVKEKKAIAENHAQLIKKQTFAKFRKENDKKYDKLNDQQKLGIQKLFGYGEDDWNGYEPDLEAPGDAEMGLLAGQFFDDNLKVDVPADIK